MKNSEYSITVLVAKLTAIDMSGGGGMEVWTPLRRIAISDVCRDVADMPVGRLMIFYIRTERKSFQEVYCSLEKVVAYTSSPNAQDIYAALSNPTFCYKQKIASTPVSDFIATEM